MSRRQKSRILQHARHLQFSRASKESAQKGSSSVNTNRPREEWERRGEGFQLTDREQAGEGSVDGNGASRRKTDVKSRRQFGQKWIQPEELLQIPGCSNAGNQRSSGARVFSSSAALKLSDVTSSPTAASEDTDHDSICWNNSDSDSEDVKKQETRPPPAKKLRTKYSARKTKQRRKSAKSQSAPVPLNPGLNGDDGNESEDAIALSASESEEEKAMFTEQGKSDQPSGSESPVLQIECIGSPDHSPSIPDNNNQFAIADPEEEALKVDDCLIKKRPVLMQKLGSPLKDAGWQAGTPSISSCASSQRTTGDSDVSPGQGGLRASEWARQVKWETTPTKQPPVTPPHQGDSGKKRKKFAKGGLAEQMSRILQREKSARSMWQHQHKASVSSQGTGSRGMLVKVSSVSTVYGLQLAKCTIVRSPASSLQPSPNPQCFVLFFSPLSSKHRAGLQCGATVHIYPPWQQVDTSAGRTLLCTRYHVNRHTTTQSQPSSSSVGSEVTKGNDATDVSLSSSPVTSQGRWMCPCSADPSLPASRCPAHLFPFLPSSIAQHNPTTHQLGELSSSGKTLHTVTCRERAPRRTLTFHTMLESIEKAPAGDRLLPAFQATVLRVFREREETISYRPWVLVEDSQGTVAVITGTGDTTLTHLEGRLCCLTCLRVHSRTNADRDPALFSAVCGAWAQRTRPSTTASQDSDPEVAHSNHRQPPCQQQMVPPPGFCYVLEVDRGAWDLMGEGEDWLTVSTTHPLTPRPPLMLTSLAHALQNQNQSSRISVLGRFLYFREKRPAQESSQNSGGQSTSQNTSVLYITDHSLQNGRVVDDSSANQGKEEISPSTQVPQDDGRLPAYVGVEVRQDCVVSGIGWDGGQFRGRQPFLVLLRDVWLVNGTWIADRYSTLVSSETDRGEAATLRARIDPDVYSTVSQCCVALPAVCVSSPTHSLVTVSGTIVGVDEKSAFSWEECDGCGSDQLATRTGSQALTCLTCRKQVSSPVQRMKMDVTVRSDTDPSVAVSVSLQQSTIEELLPDEEEEEGYEVDCVLNKAVGPLNCFLTCCTPCDTDHGRTFTAVHLLC